MLLFLGLQHKLCSLQLVYTLSEHMSNSTPKIVTLHNLYYGGFDLIDAFWEKTTALAKDLILPTAKSEILKKATFPNMFSDGNNLFFPMLDEYGDVVKVITYSARGSDTLHVRSENYKANTLMYWPGNDTNTTLYIVTTLAHAVAVKYALTYHTPNVPDVLYINSFRHTIKNKSIFDKYNKIIAIGSKQLKTILNSYGLVPTVRLELPAKYTIDPIYIVLKLLDEYIDEKDLHKSANCRIPIESLAGEHSAIFANIYVGIPHKCQRTTLQCLRR